MFRQGWWAVHRQPQVSGWEEGGNSNMHDFFCTKLYSPMRCLVFIHCSMEEESVNCFLDQNSLVGIMMLRFSRQLATQSLKGKSGFVADGFYFLSLIISPSGPDTTPWSPPVSWAGSWTPPWPATARWSDSPSCLSARLLPPGEKEGREQEERLSEGGGGGNVVVRIPARDSFFI